SDWYHVSQIKSVPVNACDAIRIAPDPAERSLPCWHRSTTSDEHLLLAEEQKIWHGALQPDEPPWAVLSEPLFHQETAPTLDSRLRQVAELRQGSWSAR